MSKKIELYIDKIPVLRSIAKYLKKVKLPGLQGYTLYDLLELYGIGIGQGALSNRAGSIAFSFFMALFPFALFILNLIPYIPIADFQDDFLKFVSETVPPNTYYAIANIIDDILHNSHSGLLSWGFLLSILLMANGLNATLAGFENAKHITVKRGIVRQYVVAVGMSLLLSFLLILTVAVIVVFEVFIQKLNAHQVLNDQIPLMVLGRYGFLILMILLTTSILFKFGTKHEKGRAFISVGSIFTTILTIIISYFFGIWVIRFSQYNQLYGSIGTLLIVMFYIWINCMVLLLGFELNAAINKLKMKNQNTEID
ncbi:YihY/virulence factor BrkB family protein [Flavobacterium muglaense]|uniref:YihY/virulence factor BrkB family protein n=1 Tax=Flavobacterium muglaense TaxID=2764716 RepID=A0A923N475_9FLAO|nr:YihY/virulence factor BrkB family protein [Flavobacterium muglaense]MBC5839239.1 YihY/virulence factor BrkB family protein [Flavobacterium muglaense]MBC5845735.1 YihY/virulence factor BrkB family protein [Flavobacterium muglaense]